MPRPAASGSTKISVTHGPPGYVMLGGISDRRTAPTHPVAVAGVEGRLRQPRPDLLAAQQRGHRARRAPGLGVGRLVVGVPRRVGPADDAAVLRRPRDLHRRRSRPTPRRAAGRGRAQIEVHRRRCRPAVAPRGPASASATSSRSMTLTRNPGSRDQTAAATAAGVGIGDRRRRRRRGDDPRGMTSMSASARPARRGASPTVIAPGRVAIRSQRLPGVGLGGLEARHEAGHAAAHVVEADVGALQAAGRGVGQADEQHVDVGLVEQLDVRARAARRRGSPSPGWPSPASRSHSPSVR